MPLSFGLVIGIAVSLVGAILFFVTHSKKLAAAMMGIGAVISFLTLALIILAANSPM